MENETGPMVIHQMRLMRRLHRRGGFFAAIALGGLGGCLVDSFTTFPPGVFEREVLCEVSAEGPNGEGQQTFTTELSVMIDEFGAMTVNGEPVELRATHVRSLPTADMGFEIVDIDQYPGFVQITLVPHPTLPGITATGFLVEEYVRGEGTITVQAEGDLTLNDIDGATNLHIDCPQTSLVLNNQE